MDTSASPGISRWRLPMLRLVVGLFPATAMAGDFVVAPTDCSSARSSSAKRRR